MSKAEADFGLQEKNTTRREDDASDVDPNDPVALAMKGAHADLVSPLFVYALSLDDTEMMSSITIP